MIDAQDRALVVQGSVAVSVAATIDPVTVIEAKKHLNLDHTDDDAYIEDLIAAATDAAQAFTNRQFITATLIQRLDYFPDEIRVPRPPLIAVASIAYVDSAGASQTLAASEYQVDTAQQPGRIRPAYGKYWPAVRSDTYNVVTVTYTAGYGATAASVPKRIRQAIKAIVAMLYEHREPIVTGVSVERIPEVAKHLLWSYRILHV